MKIPSTLLKKPIGAFFAGAVALILIFLSFLIFRMQVDRYIDVEMRSQIDEIQKNGMMLITNEAGNLKRLTASAAQMVSQTELETDADIIQSLKDYAATSNVIRAIFQTLDGEAYSNYAGYMGQSSENASIDGVPISEISEPIFSQAYYSEDLKEVVFDVAAPANMGVKQGVLISSYNISEFSKMLTNKFIDGAADVGIINSKGEVICGKEDDEFLLNIFDAMISIKFESSSLNQMRDDFANQKAGFSIYLVRDVARYCSYAPIGLNDWNIIVMVRESSLRGKLANLEHYGFQLTVELVIVMLALLTVIMTIRLREQKKTRMILEQAAMLDGLTGIFNRKATEKSIEHCLSTNISPAAALLVIDVDYFKNINDQYGHLFGDEVLKECADRLNSAFGDDGIVGRIGGDEFVVFLHNGKNTDQIKAKMDDIIHTLHVVTDTGEKQMASLSAGIAHADEKVNSFLALYEQADAALYRAKQAGRGRLSE